MVLKLNMSDKETAEAQASHTKTKQAEAAVRLKGEAEAKKKLNASDAKKIASQEKTKLKEENAVIKTQIDLREKYLAEPLTESEHVEMDALTVQANSGQNPDPSEMARLSDLRIKLKVPQITEEPDNK